LTLHVPVDRSLIVAPPFPLAEQTAGVVVVNDTARPDEDDAETVNGD
jgi:hypothetical protein